MFRISALNQEFSEESCDADETVRTKEAEVNNHLKKLKISILIIDVFVFLFRKQSL